jgi:hypothetical protein
MRRISKEDGSLFARRQKASGSVKMKTKAGQINAMTVATNAEYYCSTLQTSVLYAKLPATFVGGGLSGKFRISDIEPNIVIQATSDFCSPNCRPICP